MRYFRAAGSAVALGILLAALVPSAAVASVPGPGAASAASDDGPQTWSVAPADGEGPDGRASLDYVVEPGNVYTDHVAVQNFGEQPLTVSLYAQDAVQTAESGFEVLAPEDDAKRVGAWMTLDAAEVTVPARDQAVVPLTLTIPDDAEPGDHVGGVLAVGAPGAGSGATVQYRVGTRVHLRVAGPVEAALAVDTLDGRHETRWTPFASAPLDVAATLVNEGNVRLAPAVRVRAIGLFGWWSATGEVDGIDEILPGGASAGSARWEEVPAIGPIWVTVELGDVASMGQDVTGITAFAERTVVVWAMPWVLLATLVLLLAAAVVAVRNLRLRRRAARAVGSVPAVSGDSAP